MLNGLLMVKGVVALTTFITALFAFLTMMQIRKKIPPLLPGSPQTLRRWHVVSGRLCLASFIFLAFIGLSLALYLYKPSGIRPWLHVIASVLATIVFIAKVVVVRRKMQPWMRQLLPFGILLFLLHLAVFLTATVWAFWFKITGAL